MTLQSLSKGVLALVAAVMMPSCASCWEGGVPMRPAEAEAHAQAIAEVKAASNVTVYQGLAHPKNQKSLYKKQLGTVEHTSIHGFEFFSKPANVSDATVRRVLDLYAEPSAHQGLSRKDLCHFHPDYAFVWKTGTQENVLQICYGCHEWRYFCERGMLSTDINEPAYFDKLTKWLPQEPGRN
jgi:hypothetical protein